MKSIDVFFNIPDYQPDNSQGDPTRLSGITELEVGSGQKSFKLNREGLWMGADKFEDAPFKVDMDGNVTLSPSLGNTIRILIKDSTGTNRVLIGE